MFIEKWLARVSHLADHLNSGLQSGSSAERHCANCAVKVWKSLIPVVFPLPLLAQLLLRKQKEKPCKTLVIVETGHTAIAKAENSERMSESWVLHLHSSLLVHETLVHILRNDQFRSQLGCLIVWISHGKYCSSSGSLSFLQRTHLPQFLQDQTNFWIAAVYISRNVFSCRFKVEWLRLSGQRFFLGNFDTFMKAKFPAHPKDTETHVWFRKFSPWLTFWWSADLVWCLPDFRTTSAWCSHGQRIPDVPRLRCWNWTLWSGWTLDPMFPLSCWFQCIRHPWTLCTWL